MTKRMNGPLRYNCLLCILLLLTSYSYGKIENGSNVVYVDKIEVNSKYNELGMPQFVQVIFWDRFYSPGDKKLTWHVREWEMKTDEYWDKTDKKHKEEWMKWYSNLCNGNPNYLWKNRESFYKGKFNPNMLFYPQKNNKTGKYEMIYIKDNIRLRIIATTLEESHTQNDPERDNRKYLSENMRTGLLGKPKLYGWNEEYE